MSKRFSGILAIGNSKQEAGQQYLDIATGKDAVMAVSSTNEVFAIASTSALNDQKGVDLVINRDLRPTQFASLSGNDALTAKLTVCLDGCGKFIVSDSDLDMCPSCSASLDKVTDARVASHCLSDDVPHTEGGLVSTAATLKQALKDYNSGSLMSCSSEFSTFGARQDSNFDPYSGFHVLKRTMKSQSSALTNAKPHIFYCTAECERGVTVASDKDVVFCSHCGNSLVESGEKSEMKIGSISSKIVISGATVAAAVSSFRKTVTGERNEILTQRTKFGSFSSTCTMKFDPFDGSKVVGQTKESLNSAQGNSEFDSFEAHLFHCVNSECKRPYSISTSCDAAFCPHCNSPLDEATGNDIVGLSGVDEADESEDLDLDDGYDVEDESEDDLDDGYDVEDESEDDLDDDSDIESLSDDESELDLDDSDEDYDEEDLSDEDLESTSGDSSSDESETSDASATSDASSDESTDASASSDASSDESEVESDSEDEGDDSSSEDDSEDDLSEDDIDLDDDEDLEGDGSDDSSASSDSSEDVSSESCESVSMLEALSSVSKIDPTQVSLSFAQGLEPRWHMYYEGSPICYANLSSVSSAFGDEAKARSLFNNPQFAKAVSLSCKERGLHETIAEFGFKSHSFDLQVGSILRAKYQAQADARVDQVQKEIDSISADYKERYSAALGISLKGTTSKFWKGIKNPIAESLINSLSAAGVANPSEIVEQAFIDHGQDLFTTVMTKADELMSKSAQAQEEIAQAVMDHSPKATKSESKVIESVSSADDDFSAKLARLIPKR